MPEARAAAKFTIPADIVINAKIISATLSFYRFTGDEASNVYEDFQVVPIDSSWDVTKVTWNNQPLYFPHMAVDEVSGGQDNSWIDFDVTSKIQEFAIAPSLNNGFAFDTYAEARWMKVYSSEHNEEALRPKIVITYDNDDPVDLHQGVNKIKEGIRFKASQEHFMIYLPDNLNYTVNIYTISGRKLSSLSINGKNQWRRIPIMNSPGMQIIRVTSSAGIVIKKINLLK